MKRSEFMRVLLKYVKSLPKDEVENIKAIMMNYLLKPWTR